MKVIILSSFLMMNICLYAQEVTLSAYSKSPLSDVFLVTSDKNKLSVTGYDGSSTTASTKVIALQKGEVLAIWNWKFYPSLSIMTVPFKVRRELDGKSQQAMSGLTNFGLNISIPEIKLDRYFSKGTKSSHSLSAGLYLAPNVEELTPLNTTVPISESSSKQLFITTALSVVYTYNNIQLSFIPLAYDIATTSDGKKWIYNEKSWFGFGIGFDPKIFSPLLNSK